MRARSLEVTGPGSYRLQAACGSASSRSSLSLGRPFGFLLGWTSNASWKAGDARSSPSRFFGVGLVRLARLNLSAPQPNPSPSARGATAALLSVVCALVNGPPGPYKKFSHMPEEPLPPSRLKH
jgi:hypothetical protein